MKKLSLVLGFLLIGVIAFAQSKNSVGLKDSDVKNFIKNYDKIQKEFEKFGDMSDVQIMNEWAKADANGTNLISKVLEKYGISGPNSYEKFTVITGAYAVIQMEEEYNKLDAETLSLYKSMGIDLPFSQLKQGFNSSDYNIVKKNFAGLQKVLAK